MSTTRPKALVTAAVSGPGLDLLHQLADLVLDSWLDQPSLRIYNAKQLAERASDVQKLKHGLAVRQQEFAAKTTEAAAQCTRLEAEVVARKADFDRQNEEGTVRVQEL